MSRMAVLLIVALAITGCEKNTGGEAEPLGEAASATAVVEFRDKTYQLAVISDCVVKPNGEYSVWAFTLDTSGTPIPDATHLHALREENWSVIDLYIAEEEQIFRIYRDGSETFGFENGVLEFDGALGAGLTERARLRIVCPK